MSKKLSRDKRKELRSQGRLITARPRAMPLSNDAALRRHIPTPDTSAPHATSDARDASTSPRPSPRRDRTLLVLAAFLLWLTQRSHASNATVDAAPKPPSTTDVKSPQP